ncbi:MAG: tetratricopeptide repeat-containing sensor histidine kinase [Candidatus Kapaibacteriota bacterium]
MRIFRFALLFILLVLVCSTPNCAQTPRTDSLEALLANKTPATDSARIQILCDLSKEYESRNAIRALIYARQALLFADSLHFKFGLAKSQLRMGVVLWTQGFYEQSVEYNFKALRIWQDLKDSANIAYALGGIGANYRKMGNYPKAKDYYTQALTLSTNARDRRGMESMLNNLGVLCFGEGMYDSALVYWQRALGIDIELRDSASIALVSANVAWAFNHKGEQETALQFAEQALRTAENIGDKRDAALACNVLAEIYMAKSLYTTAEHYQRNALRLAEEYGGREIIRWSYKMLSEIAQRTGKSDEALRYYKDFQAMNDSMHTTETAERTAVLTTQYRDEQRIAEIARLRDEAEQQSHIRNLLIASVLLLLALFAAGFSRYQYKRRTENERLRQQQILETQAMEIEMANTQLAEQNQQLHDLNEEKNEILGIVAHDLKNPIGAVRSYGEMISLDEISPSEIQNIGESIVQTSNRMLELVNNVLNANTIESGKMHLMLTVLEAAPIVEMLVDEYIGKAVEKGLTLHFMNLADAASTQIQVDESAFMQIIENILSNAVKYSPYNKNIWIRINKKERSQQQWVVIEIQDEGPGFTNEDKEKLFGKFARLSARPTGGEHSTGLGLSIVKKLVELMNGTVRCESTPQKGATFTLEFPPFVSE